MTDVTKYKITWEAFSQDMDKLACKVKPLVDSHEIIEIAGIPRGGLIPAVILSHKLKIPLIPITCATVNTLIVDDIADSGETLTEYVDKFLTATVYIRKHLCKVKPIFTGTQILSNDWLVFPWELESGTTIQDYKLK